MPAMKPDTEAPAEQQGYLRSWEQKDSLQGNLRGGFGREPPAVSHDLTHAVSLLVSGNKTDRCGLIVHRITESQNSRGWKGPLWVI